MAVSATYLNPNSVNGQATSTPITAAQALGANRITFQITASADADTTTGSLTHAKGYPAGPGPNGGTLANGAPVVNATWLLSNAQLSLWFASALTTNNVTFTKTTTSGSGNASPQVNMHLIDHSVID
jgi:hypothetical protein